MDKHKRNGLVLLLFLLWAFWLIMASSFEWVDVIIGFFASSLIVWYCYDLILSKKEATPLTRRSAWLWLVIIVTMMTEVVKANIDVAKIVLHPKLPIQPSFHTMAQPLKKDLNRTLYGNAITLTPGTLTVVLDETQIVVHALTEKAAQGICSSPIEKAFVALESLSND